jgi:hypothetical protein
LGRLLVCLLYSVLSRLHALDQTPDRIVESRREGEKLGLQLLNERICASANPDAACNLTNDRLDGPSNLIFEDAALPDQDIHHGIDSVRRRSQQPLTDLLNPPADLCNAAGDVPNPSDDF